MRFLADESCDFAVVRALRAGGHDVVAVKDAMAGAMDEDVARFAMRENRVLLTEDRDFGRLVYALSGLTLGVIYMRFPSHGRTTMAKVVCDLVMSWGNKLEGKFAVVKPGRVRISSPPS